MSYNYLPLDSTPTNFNQLRYLLSFNQQISVTFTAFEAIAKSRNFLDEKMAETDAVSFQNALTQQDLAWLRHEIRLY
jgi:histidine ammonia-lyase